MAVISIFYGPNSSDDRLHNLINKLQDQGKEFVLKDITKSIDSIRWLKANGIESEKQLPAVFLGEHFVEDWKYVTAGWDFNFEKKTGRPEFDNWEFNPLVSPSKKNH